MSTPKKASQEIRIPLQVKVESATREKLKRIASENGLSLNDVATLSIAAGMEMVHTKLHELRAPKKAA